MQYLRRTSTFQEKNVIWKCWLNFFTKKQHFKRRSRVLCNLKESLSTSFAYTHRYKIKTFPRFSMVASKHCLKLYKISLCTNCNIKETQISFWCFPIHLHTWTIIKVDFFYDCSWLYPGLFQETLHWLINVLKPSSTSHPS